MKTVTIIGMGLTPQDLTAEHLKVIEEEVKDKIKTIAKEMKQDPLKVEATFKKNNNLDGLKESIKREKIIDFLSKKIKIKKSKKEGTSK